MIETWDDLLKSTALDLFLPPPCESCEIALAQQCQPRSQCQWCPGLPGEDKQSHPPQKRPAEQKPSHPTCRAREEQEWHCRLKHVKVGGSSPPGEAVRGSEGSVLGICALILGDRHRRDGLGLSLATKPFEGFRAELSPLQPLWWFALHHSVFPTKNASPSSLAQPLAALPRGGDAPCHGSPQQHPVLLPPLLLLPCSHSCVTAPWGSGKLGRFPTPLLHWDLTTGCYRDPPVPAQRQDSPTCTPLHSTAQATGQGQHPG